VFLRIPAYPGGPGPTAVKRSCVCVCVRGRIGCSAGGRMKVGFVSYAAIVELDASTASYSGSSSIPASEPLPSPAMSVHDGLGWIGTVA